MPDDIRIAIGLAAAQPARIVDYGTPTKDSKEGDGVVMIGRGLQRVHDLVHLGLRVEGSYQWKT